MSKKEEEQEYEKVGDLFLFKDNCTTSEKVPSAPIEELGEDEPDNGLIETEEE